jgi:hypothetical protein
MENRLMASKGDRRMSRSKLLVAACFTVFALSALASATASAGEWMVNGTKLTGSAAILSTALVLSEGRLFVPNVLSIKCKAHEVGITGGKIIAPDGVLATSINFKECAVTEGNPTCELATKTISTVPVNGLALLEGTLNTYIHISPETKAAFATIKFSGETCALLGVQPVTGNASLLIHEGFDERALHLTLAFSLPKSLKVGSSEALLEGLSADVRLESNQNWSFL